METQVDADIPISFAPVVMLSPPDTQHGPQDVFHTPPEESLLPSSVFDLPPCMFNQAVDLDDGSEAFVELAGFSDSSEFVDFGKDSELGFSQDAQLKNEIDADSVTENRSYGFRVLEKGLSDFSESPVKKLKLEFEEGKVENACKFGEDVQPQSNGVGGEEVNDDSCREIQMYGNSVLVDDVEMQNLIPEENVEIEVVENAGGVNLVMVNNSNNETGEGTGMREDLLEEATGNGSGIKRRTENETKGLTLLEVAMRAGITFRRPHYYPPGRKSKFFKFDDEVNDDSCGEIQMDVNSVPVEDVEMQNLILEENVETEVVQNAGDVNLIMGNNSNNETGEGSGTCEDLLEEETGIKRRTAEEKKPFVFDVLRVLAENAKKNENETKGLTLLEAATRAGVTFPRPSWHPKGRKSENLQV